MTASHNPLISVSTSRWLSVPAIFRSGLSYQRLTSPFRIVRPWSRVDEDLYLFKPFRKCVKRSSSWEPRLPSDLNHWNESLDSSELKLDFRIGDQVDDFTQRSVLSIIKTNWDSFCEREVPLPVLDFVFFIDTGDSTPVYCRQRQHSYGYHEQKIMKKHITALEDSGLIVACEGPWAFLLFLAPKPH